MYARKITPFSPKINANGLIQFIKIFAIYSPPIDMLLTSQMTTPAGIAKTIARQSTKIVLSIKDVKSVCIILGGL
jgi:hypothetical protein